MSVDSSPPVEFFHVIKVSAMKLHYIASTLIVLPFALPPNIALHTDAATVNLGACDFTHRPSTYNPAAGRSHRGFAGELYRCASRPFTVYPV